MPDSLPIDTRFQLGEQITPVQEAFFEEHGFLHFEGVLNVEEVRGIKDELSAVEAQWIETGRTHVHGIPIFYGRRASGRPFVQRFAFTSLFSEGISTIVNDVRFKALLPLVGEDARIGEAEKDGVVVNRYINEKGSIYKRLGWHTDGLRDLFCLRMPKRMLNVGLHLDEVGEEKGGLRLLPGTHLQGFFSMCFRKLYFLWHRRDPKEICVLTQPGDLTVHDGRLWHRVARAKMKGEESLRHSIYVPYLTGPVEPKGPESKTPGYHRFGGFLRWIKRPFVGFLLGVGLAGTAQAEPNEAPEALAEDALAGTFALRVEVSHVVKLPLLPSRVNTGINVLLVKREHVGGGRYGQTAKMCSVRNGSVLGSAVQVRDEALRNLPLSHDTVTLDSATGRYSSRGHAQLWGIKPVPEAYNAPFPKSLEETHLPPFSEWIFDMDEDGELGVSMFATGLASGQLSGIQRKRFSLEGKALSADRILGLVSMRKESLVLASTSRVIKAGRFQLAHSAENKAASFFEELRVADNATCETVRRMFASGDFLEESPF